MHTRLGGHEVHTVGRMNMLVTISLMILRVQNHGQHCDALQAHESTQPVLKGISEILSLIYLIYYLITATRALAVFSLSMDYT